MGTDIEKRIVLALKGKYCKDCIIYTEEVDLGKRYGKAVLVLKKHFVKDGPVKELDLR